MRMAAWTFPSNDGFDYFDAINRLSDETITPVRDQHTVSRGILKGFGMPSVGGRGGWQLGRYDKITDSWLDPKGLKSGGKVYDFIPYASGSAERLWHSVETRLGEAITAAENRSLHADIAHEETIKMAIALHFVRSAYYRRIHEKSFHLAMKEVQSEILAEKGERG